KLLFMLADPEVSADQLAAAARGFGAVFEVPCRPHWPHFEGRAQAPWRRLKIGFLSPDFRVHSVMYFVEGILAQLDRRQFEVFALYLFPRDDHVTERVKRHADHFVRLGGFTPDQQAEMIRAQGIDILVDLAGHTGHNGLLAMARKAAPVQATWVGFPGTTGLSAMDYLITDSITDPPGVEDEYTEALYRLPTRLCTYRPMSRNLLWRYQPRYLVQPAPALANGHITFGSCNNLGKITDQVLSLWGQILARTPGSRLLIEAKNFGKSQFIEEYKERCGRLGIDPERLILVPLDTKNQYLTYHRIDIALDPFPLNGGTTSMDALWMGTPLVGLAGTSFKSRLTAGILGHLGRNEWLAQTAEEYVDIACRLANDTPALAAMRQNLRAELEQSALMNEDIFLPIFGDALRDMWFRWQAAQEAPGNDALQAQKINEWIVQMPAPLRDEAAPIGVGIAPGQRVALSEAHEMLQKLVDTAKDKSPQPQHDQLVDPRWVEVTQLSETVLAAVPHDPVALACLAEVEFAHSHVEFAVTYLRYAEEAIARKFGAATGSGAAAAAAAAGAEEATAS
ncbi:MAG: acetylglucosamine transferase, partial [Comamonadaceae bacterium]